MAANVKATLTRDFTSTAASWIGEASGTLPGSAERLVLLLTMRAYAAGQTRTLIVKWEGVPVTVRQTSLLGTITQQEDFHYWIGTLDNPPLTGKTVDVDASGSIRGMLATLFFVEAVDDTVPIIVHDFQDRDVSGNSVTLNGTPARAGSVIVSANGLNPASTVTSFTPNGWSTAFSGTATGGGNQTTAIRYTQAASTAAVETTAQFGTSDVNRGGVLFEIQTAVSAGVGVTESVSPSDSIGAPIVAVSVGLTEALTASDSSSASIPADTPAANPPGVWTGAAASWKLPSGLDSKGGGALTVSGLSAATIKGPGATFATASYARRTAPALGALANFAVEFWVKPTAAGQIWYAGPRGAVAGNVARIGVDANRAWQLVRGVSTAVQTAVSAANAVSFGSSYHVIAVFQSGSDIRLYVNGEPVTLTMTGAAVTGALTLSSNDEIALGDPTGGIGSTTDWWALPIRSGRPWAAGGAFWSDADLWSGEAADTALPDAGTGSSKGFKDSSNPGGANVQTWDGVLGGPLSGGLVSTNTQFDWSPSVYYYFGDVVANLPTGAAYPDGSGWLFWTGQFIPTSRRTDTGDSSIWDEIIAGTHDAKFVKFGERAVIKMTAVGHPVKRLIIDFHHEMNQSNVYQVYTGTRLKYKSAMERIINKVREGAGQHIRFCHRPAYSGEAANEGRIAAYQDWVPANIDVCALSVHPGQAVDSDANITKMFNGTLNANWYGIQEFLDAATTLGKPIAFPEWSPKNEVGKACPVSKRFVERFHPEILVPNQPRLVADCVYGRAMRDPSGYLESDTAGKNSWAAMVPLRKTLWSGIKSS